MSNKNQPVQETQPSLNSDMSFWAMSKELVAGAGNVTLHLLQGTNEFAGAFNNLGQATNAGSRVIKDYALIEEAEAQSLLLEKREALK